MDATNSLTQGRSMAPPQQRSPSDYRGFSSLQPPSHARGLPPAYTRGTEPRRTCVGSDPGLSTWDPEDGNSNQIQSLAPSRNIFEPPLQHSPFTTITRAWIDDPNGPPTFLADGPRLGEGHPETCYPATPALTQTSSEDTSHYGFARSYTTKPSSLDPRSPMQTSNRTSWRAATNSPQISPTTQCPPKIRLNDHSLVGELNFFDSKPLPKRQVENTIRPADVYRDNNVEAEAGNNMDYNGYHYNAWSSRLPMPPQEFGVLADDSGDQLSRGRSNDRILPHPTGLSPSSYRENDRRRLDDRRVWGGENRPTGTKEWDEECRAPSNKPQQFEAMEWEAEQNKRKRQRGNEDYHTLAPPTKTRRLAQLVNRPHRPFYCTFLFAGCTQTFATKNEWKRHVATQHIQHKIWRCDFPSCSDRKAATFNRKDLFGQHLRRMHVPDSAKNEQKSKGPRWLQFVNSDIPKIQERCCIMNRPLPERSSCGFCRRDFHGEGSWDERMEHVGRHYENAIANAENVEPSAWTPDRHLIEYALREGLVQRHSDGTYTLVNTSGKEQVTVART